ncbi:MAG: prolyl-tRNA synthetase associated domain-containing protein [Pseudomonadota bacterium]
MTAPTAEVALCTFLGEIGVSHDIHRHAPLFTVADSKAATAHLPGAHTKNLFLKDKKGALFLVTCMEDRQIRMKPLERALGAKRLSFGSPELLAEVLGVIPGAVTPFAAFNDRGSGRVTAVLDQQMMATSPQNFHPLHNAATIVVEPDGLLRFFAATGHEPRILDFDALEAASRPDTAE